ncbi:MAG: DinB family protein [Candidatus Bathyarchaeota archaeon]
MLTDFLEYIFRRVTQTADEITPDELDWQLVEEANSIHWILTHLTKIAYLLIPQVITGTYNPAGWDDHYEEEPHSLEELRYDLKEARENVLSLLGDLSEEDINREIMIWG